MNGVLHVWTGRRSSGFQTAVLLLLAELVVMGDASFAQPRPEKRDLRSYLVALSAAGIAPYPPAGFNPGPGPFVAPGGAPQPNPDERVSLNETTLGFGFPQLEPSVASHPSPSSRLAVAGFIYYQVDATPGYSRTTDRGRSWSNTLADGRVLPAPPGFNWGNRSTPGFVVGGDPSLAWGLDNTVYYATIVFQDRSNPPSGTCSIGGLYIYRSTDAGATWTLPANGPAIPNTQTNFRDKVYVAADTNPSSPFAGNLYMVWMDQVFQACPNISEGSGFNLVSLDVLASTSIDGGFSWSAPLQLSTSPGIQCVGAPFPAVAPNGDLFVAFIGCEPTRRVLVRKSTNGGTSFAAAVPASQTFGVTHPVQTNPNKVSFRHNTFPFIAVDPTASAKVYVAWDQRTDTSALNDIYANSSSNGGLSFGSTPVRVNDDPLTLTRDQFFPNISVARDGMVQVSWGDERLDAVNTLGKEYNIFFAQSRNGGVSFSKNVRMSTAASNPDFDGFSNPDFIGDYFGLSASGIAVWADLRFESVFQDIYAAPRCHLDIDVDHAQNSLTDGLLALRFLFGFTGNTLVTGAIGPGAIRSNSDEIQAYLDGCKTNLLTYSMLDVDGNGAGDALTDGLLIMRWLFGFSGSDLIQGTVAPNCTRCTAPVIEEHIQSFGYTASTP